MRAHPPTNRHGRGEAYLDAPGMAEVEALVRRRSVGVWFLDHLDKPLEANLPLFPPNIEDVWKTVETYGKPNLKPLHVAHWELLSPFLVTSSKFQLLGKYFEFRKVATARVLRDSCQACPVNGPRSFSSTGEPVQEDLTFKPGEEKPAISFTFEVG